MPESPLEVFLGFADWGRGSSDFGTREGRDKGVAALGGKGALICSKGEKVN